MTSANYYCYVYYDEQWQAYYVGKGQNGRIHKSQNHPVVPPKERIQRFDFEQEWQAFECEIELIAFWGRQSDGGTLLNKSTGGPGCPGFKHSEETRTKLSAAHKGKKLSAETRAKLSAALKGEKHHNYGKPLSAEHRSKISAANKGKKLSAETRAKISAARKKKK